MTPSINRYSYLKLKGKTNQISQIINQWFQNMNKDERRLAQLEDPEMKGVLKLVEAGRVPPIGERRIPKGSQGENHSDLDLNSQRESNFDLDDDQSKARVAKARVAGDDNSLSDWENVDRSYVVDWEDLVILDSKV
jgi:hypothetical protein